MPGDPYMFSRAVETRDAVIKQQKREITKLYADTAKEIGKLADYYGRKEGNSAALQAQYYAELQRQVVAMQAEVSKNFEKMVQTNADIVAGSVAQCNSDWLAKFGIAGEGVNASLSNICNTTVNNILSGNIYADGKSLSTRVWQDLQTNIHDIRTILAQDMVEQKSVQETAKDLQQYVNPNVRRSWNLRMSDGRYIYKGQVDYASQRLARTVAQHTYQQTFVNTTAKNPFVLKYIWHANGSRACPFCLDRDGLEFEKWDLPLDHPMGMCTMEPVVMSDAAITGALADWVANPGLYPEIDEYAADLGFEE